MSKFAVSRFSSHEILTQEEQGHKEEIIQITEKVLQAKRIKCDASISKIAEEKLEKSLKNSETFPERRRNNQMYKFLRKNKRPIYTMGDK